MALTRFRRPHKLSLPGGYSVPIVYWSARKMAAWRATDPTDNPRMEVHGFWDGKQIVVNATDPLWLQIETIGHEAVHAVHDWAAWLKETYADPIRREAVLEEEEAEDPEAA